MTREQANRRLLKVLGEAVDLHTDWRFGQILFNYGYVDHAVVNGNSVIKDPFHEESEKTLVRVNENKADGS